MLIDSQDLWAGSTRWLSAIESTPPPTNTRWPGWATVYTDASFGRSRGWGAWIRVDGGRRRAWGKCPPWVRNANDAEVVAITLGVVTCLETWPTTVAVGVRTDSRAAISWTNGALGGRHFRAQTEALHACFEYLRAWLAGRRLRLVWVKGHRPKHSSTQAWLNDRVDALSRADGR